VNEAEVLAFFYLIPVALWLTILAILLQVWWGGKLEDSLAYLVFLRERKVLFVSLIAGMAAVHLVNESVKILYGVGGISESTTLTVGLMASLAGAALVFLFAWFLLRGAQTKVARPIVLDVPPHMVYSLGVLDRAEQEQREHGTG